MSDEIQKNILTEIRERHELGDRWRYGPSLICPQSHEDRGWLLTEIERLRARVEVLEKVRAAAQAIADEDAGDDPAEDVWWDWEKNCEVLRDALEEAKP